MPILAPFFPAPGVVREGTRYTAKGVWYDSNLIRWRKGMPEEMGGWTRLPESYLGIARKLHDWGTIKGMKYLGVGSTTKLYINDTGGYHDITPIVNTVALGNDPITTTINTGLLAIAITNHDAIVGDFILISGIAGDIATIPQASLNGEHRVVGVIDANNLQVVISDLANASTTGGGASATADMLLVSGINVFVPSTGWGSGSWGAGVWGGSAALSLATQLRLWSIDNFGNDLLACPRLGGVYYWQESNGVSVRAVPIGDLVRRTILAPIDPITTINGSTVVLFTDTDHRAAIGDSITISGVVQNSPPGTANGVPLGELNTVHIITGIPNLDQFEVTVTTPATVTTNVSTNPLGDSGGNAVNYVYRTGGEDTPIAALQVMTSPVGRHVIAFGANDTGETEPSDLLVRWSSSENPPEFTDTETNSAGRFPISTGSAFIGALRTRQEILIWTDTGVVSMRYVGAPFIFTFTEIEAGVSMISPNAAVNAGGVTYFMDRGAFYAYDGRVRRIPCSIRDDVFSDIDPRSSFKITSGVNLDFSEVMWFYPSKGGGGEIDSYVKYNYDENIWDWGVLSRAAWIDAPTRESPRAASILSQGQILVPGTAVMSSPVVTFAFPNHKMVTGDQVILKAVTTLSAFSQITYDTIYTVTVVGPDSFTVSMGANASVNQTIDTTVTRPNVVYRQEDGFDDDGDIMPSFIESGDFDIEDGHDFWFLTRFIPDIQFRGNFDDESVVGVQFRVHDFPGAPIRTDVDVSVKPGTTQRHVRTRARQISLRISGEGLGYGWRSGKFRVGARKDGRR